MTRIISIAGLILLGLALSGFTAARMLLSDPIPHWTRVDTVALLIAGLAFSVAAFKWIDKRS